MPCPICHQEHDTTSCPPLVVNVANVVEPREPAVEGFPAPLTGSCTFCGETGITFPHTCKVDDINKGSEEEMDKSVDQCTAPSRCVIHSPNRFDPYEALDAVEKRLGRISTIHIGELLGHLHALRAYITGMEHE